MQTHLPPGAPLRHGKLLPARPATQKVWSLPLLLCFLLSYDKFSWPFQTKDQTSLSFYYSNLNNVFVFLNFFPSQKSISCSDFRSDFSSLCSVLELLTHLVRRPLSVTFSPSLSAKILSYAWLASPLLRSAHLVGGGEGKMGAWHGRSMCLHHVSLGNGSSHPPLRFYLFSHENFSALPLSQSLLEAAC